MFCSLNPILLSLFNKFDVRLYLLKFDSGYIFNYTA